MILPEASAIEFLLLALQQNNFAISSNSNSWKVELKGFENVELMLLFNLLEQNMLQQFYLLNLIKFANKEQFCLNQMNDCVKSIFQIGILNTLLSR